MTDLRTVKLVVQRRGLVSKILLPSLFSFVGLGRVASIITASTSLSDKKCEDKTRKSTRTRATFQKNS